jgi:hypothetical protein
MRAKTGHNEIGRKNTLIKSGLVDAIFAPSIDYTGELIDYEWEQYKYALETRLLCKMYGSAPPGGWTNAQIGAALEELDRAQRQDPVLTARLCEKHGGGWDDWTWEEIDDARQEIWRERT